MPINIVPKFLQKAFASSGAKADIPVDADLLNGRAGYNEGFPPVNMTPVAAGGIPPYGQDMNGVLYDLSSAIQYLQSGVNFPFDSAFATAVGGYAAGAIVSDPADKTLLWVNGAANNTAFPSGWTSFKYSDPTETVRGMPMAATAAEMIAGASQGKMATPKGMKDAGLWPIGFGQSLSNALASTPLNTNITNTKNRTIFVFIQIAGYHPSNISSVIVDGFRQSSYKNQARAVGDIASNDQTSWMLAVVPPGSVYNISISSGYRVDQITLLG